MALKIRLRQQGRNNRAFYRLVVTDTRSPRDGKYVENLGWYDPLENNEDKQVSLKQDRIQHWLDVGAQFTENARQLVGRTAPVIVKNLEQKVMAKKAKNQEKAKVRRKKKASIA